MKKPILKIIVGFILAFSIFITILVGYLYFTYIDEIIVEGTAYGFTIQENKREVFLKAKKLFNDKTIFYGGYETLSRARNSRKILIFSDSDYKHLLNYDIWYFAYDNSFRDSINLKFDTKDKLVEIHRHRQYFEGS